MTRGIKHEVDEFIKRLSCQFLPFKYKGQDTMLQVRVSPIQLWDISFPAEHKDVMLTTLYGKSGGATMNKRHNKWAMMIRKILGVNKIPKEWDSTRQLPSLPAHTEMVAIGIKEDEIAEDGTEQI